MTDFRESARACSSHGRSLYSSFPVLVTVFFYTARLFLVGLHFSAKLSTLFGNYPIQASSHYHYVSLIGYLQYLSSCKHRWICPHCGQVETDETECGNGKTEIWKWSSEFKPQYCIRTVYVCIQVYSSECEYQHAFTFDLRPSCCSTNMEATVVIYS